MKRTLSVAAIVFLVLCTGGAWACGPSGNAESAQGAPPSNQPGGFQTGAPDVTGQVLGTNGGGAMTPINVVSTNGSGGSSGVSGGGGTAASGGVGFSDASGSVVGTTSTDSAGNVVLTPSDTTNTTGTASPVNFTSGVFTAGGDTRSNTTGFNLSGAGKITFPPGTSISSSSAPSGNFAAGAQLLSFSKAKGSTASGQGTLTGGPATAGAVAANIAAPSPLWDANQRYSDEP